MFMFAPFVLSNWRALIVALALAAVVAAGLYERHALIVQGEQDALRKVEKANAQSQTGAARAAKNVDDCFAAGGAWNRDSGECVPNDAAGK